jgi:hypothetical protein
MALRVHETNRACQSEHGRELLQKQFTELKKQSHECIIYQTCQAMYLSIINVNVIIGFNKVFKTNIVQY